MFIDAAHKWICTEKLAASDAVAQIRPRIYGVCFAPHRGQALA